MDLGNQALKKLKKKKKKITKQLYVGMTPPPPPPPPPPTPSHRGGDRAYSHGINLSSVEIRDKKKKKNPVCHPMEVKVHSFFFFLFLNYYSKKA
jgi:hypothetical protein